MQDLTTTDDLLNMRIAITATPEVYFEKDTAPGIPSTDQLPLDTGGFLLSIDAALQYRALSQIISGFMAGKRFDISEGFFATYIVVSNVTVTGNQQGHLLLKVDFEGSFYGSVLFSGTPVYNEDTKSVVLLSLRYKLQSKNMLLKGAQLLFASRIEKELKKAANLSLNQYIEAAQKALKEYLNKEWTKGVKGSGDVTYVRILGVQALAEHLQIRAQCQGTLRIMILNFAFDLNR